MEYKRVNGRIDVNDAIDRGLIVYDEDEKHGSDIRYKFWFNNYGWIYKEVDNDYSTFQDYAELISYEIANLLGIDCAEYDLAVYNGKKGVISKSVVKEGEKIVSGTDLLSTVYDEYFVPKLELYNNFNKLLEEYAVNSLNDLDKIDDKKKNKFIDKLIILYNQSCNSITDMIKDNSKIDIKELFEYCSSLSDVYDGNFKEMKNGIMKSNNLYDIWSAVEIYSKISGYKVDSSSFMKDLTNLFVFDIITSQGDRHADNWSVIIDNKTGKLRLSGIYDNSGALALNRSKAIVNIDDFSNKLAVENRPNKRKGIYRRLKEIINHSFSGLKVTSDNVMNRNKNDVLLNTFIGHSSMEFVERLKKCSDIISDDSNIERIFNNIERKTGEPVPNIVKNVAKEVLKYNVDTINEIIDVRRGIHK